MSSLNFKRRLGVLVQVTSGSQFEFAKRLTAQGVKTHPSTVSRWIDQNSVLLPTVADLIGIALVEPRVSVDFMIGRRQPETITEQFIEERL